MNPVPSWASSSGGSSPNFNECDRLAHGSTEMKARGARSSHGKTLLRSGESRDVSRGPGRQKRSFVDGWASAGTVKVKRGRSYSMGGEIAFKSLSDSPLKEPISRAAVRRVCRVVTVWVRAFGKSLVVAGGRRQSWPETDALVTADVQPSFLR